MYYTSMYIHIIYMYIRTTYISDFHYLHLVVSRSLCSLANYGEMLIYTLMHYMTLVSL